MIFLINLLLTFLGFVKRAPPTIGYIFLAWREWNSEPKSSASSIIATLPITPMIPYLRKRRKEKVYEGSRTLMDL